MDACSIILFPLIKSTLYCITCVHADCVFARNRYNIVMDQIDRVLAHETGHVFNIIMFPINIATPMVDKIATKIMARVHAVRGIRIMSTVRVLRAAALWIQN